MRRAPPPLRAVTRRAFALGAVGLVAACQRRSDAAPAPPHPSATTPSGRRGSTKLVEWSFDGAVSTRTAVLVPTWGGEGARFPVLVALHGRGEARKPPAEGALGWPHDYALGHAIERVAAPPLTAADFEGFVDDARLAHDNQDLADHPFGGLLVVCPYLPDLDPADAAAVAAFGAFVRGELLSRVRRELPALPDARSTGIDGVSLGGVVALDVGLASPASFGAVGTLQPALDARDASTWAARAVAARRENPRLAIRLVTSDGDYFREAVKATSAAFTAAGVVHDDERLQGPHDYPFNRGPGAIEMLLWHDRVLRRPG